MTGPSGPNWDLFRATCDTQTMAISAADPDQPDMPLIYTNRQFLDLTGYREDDVLGRNCRFLQGPDTRDCDRQALRDAIAKRRYSAHCLLNYRKDGTPFYNVVVIDDVRIDRDKRVLLGCQYRISNPIRTVELQEQFERTDTLLFGFATQTQKQLKETLVMRTEALSALVRARMMMAWIYENVDNSMYRVTDGRP